MNAKISKTVFPAAVLSALALIGGSASVSAGTMEALRAQVPLAGFSAASLARSASGIPAVPAPVRGAAEKKASALPNFARVSDALYRSGQPTRAGMDQLRSSGIKTILKLNDNSPAESQWASDDGVTLVPMLMSTQQSPSYGQIDQALAVINDPSKQPVLVHCKLGHDRTGAVVAAYRVTVQGWSVDQAASEALRFGYSDPHFENIAAYLQGYVAHAQQRAASAGRSRRQANLFVLTSPEGDR